MSEYEFHSDASKIPPEPDTGGPQPGPTANGGKSTNDKQWPEPHPLPDSLLPVASFDSGLIPEKTQRSLRINSPSTGPAFGPSLLLNSFFSCATSCQVLVSVAICLSH
jgi:hypothetical protein